MEPLYIQPRTSSFLPHNIAVSKTPLSDFFFSCIIPFIAFIFQLAARLEKRGFWSSILQNQDGQTPCSDALSTCCHLHAARNCSVGLSRGASQRQEPIWPWESQEFPMPITMHEEVRQNSVPQAMHVLLSKVLQKVPVRAPRLLREQSRVPLLQQLEDQGRRTQVPLGPIRPLALALFGLPFPRLRPTYPYYGSH